MGPATTLTLLTNNYSRQKCSDRKEAPFGIEPEIEISTNLNEKLMIENNCKKTMMYYLSENK